MFVGSVQSSRHSFKSHLAPLLVSGHQAQSMPYNQFVITFHVTGTALQIQIQITVTDTGNEEHVS